MTDRRSVATSSNEPRHYYVAPFVSSSLVKTSSRFSRELCSLFLKNTRKFLRDYARIGVVSTRVTYIITSLYVLYSRVRYKVAIVMAYLDDL